MLAFQAVHPALSIEVISGTLEVFWTVPPTHTSFHKIYLNQLRVLEALEVQAWEEADTFYAGLARECIRAFIFGTTYALESEQEKIVRFLQQIDETINFYIHRVTGISFFGHIFWQNYKEWEQSFSFRYLEYKHQEADLYKLEMLNINNVEVIQRFRDGRRQRMMCINPIEQGLLALSEAWSS